MTALFADIKGSMELMEGLDPEEARAIQVCTHLSLRKNALYPQKLGPIAAKFWVGCIAIMSGFGF